MNWLEEMNHTPESGSKALEDMMSFEGWKVLQAWMQNGINTIENEIWNQEDMSQERFERLKDRRKNMKDLLKGPEVLAKSLKAKSPNMEFDPYG